MSATRYLVVIGGGEHARVVIEAARSGGAFSVRGFVDPDPCVVTSERLEVPRLGDDTALAGLPTGTLCVLGLGTVGADRRRAVDRLSVLVKHWVAVVHARAWVSATALVEPGAVIMAGAMVNSGARIGAHAVINTGAIVEHDVVVGYGAQIAPRAVLGGGASVGDGAFVGLGACVRDHIRIGSDAFVGMGVVVTADVPDGVRQRPSL